MQEYVNVNSSQFITFNMPVTTKPYTDKRLFAFFEGLIPEGYTSL